MIRSITSADAAAVLALTIAAGMFPANETEVVDKLLASYFGGAMETGHACIIDDDSEVLGAAYYAPEAATDRTWDLTMIAVHPDVQGQGRGTALLRYVENTLRARGERLLLVKTSGLPTYARTRLFYAKCAYQEEARVRDYWTAGDDLVVFRKALSDQ